MVVTIMEAYDLNKITAQQISTILNESQHSTNNINGSWEQAVENTPIKENKQQQRL